MSAELAFHNAKIVLADAVIDGSLSTRDGIIADYDSGPSQVGEDLDGDYLIPGLVELHTDHLENHYRPRPGVFWEPVAALHAHDSQIIGSGITTVFDAVRIGSAIDLPDIGEHVGALVGAITSGRDENRLRAQHFVHLRSELPTHDVLEHFEQLAVNDIVKLASLMDHTPGQRQFRSLEAYKQFYAGKMGRSEEETERYLNDRLEEQARYSAANRAAIVALAAEIGLALASHDDATLDHVTESVRDGVSIAEFPTTIEAAEASHKAGLSVLMGAPNVVRGKSHSGNISANDLARAGLLDVLSSDYVPFALMQAAFALPERVDTITLPQALATVTSNPARAAGLTDRGEISIGKKADLVRVTMLGGTPIVRAVWRDGRRVG